jgi:hypothetical protein
MSECFYDFDKIENIKKFICFSDEEGGAPFTFKDDEDLLQSVTDNQQNKTVVKALVESSFDCEDGLLTQIKQNIAVGFLGDLLDNNDKSIRVLQKMITLKNQNMTSVILIGGNRDFNKVRMGIECYMTKDDALLPWYKSTNEMYATPKEFIDSLKTIEFKYRVETKDQIDYLTFGDYNFSSKNRFQEMTKTLGFVSVNFYNEMKALFPDLNDESTEILDRFTCAMQMILSFEWKLDTIPTFFHDYVGLYTKYIELCHICALFKINDKYGFMSHAGYVHLTSPLGLDLNVTTVTDALLSIMKKSENEKITLLSQLSTLKDATNQSYTQNLSLHTKIAKFVQLTAPEICNGKSCHKFAPIITQSARTSQEGYLKEIKLKITGGSWKDDDEKSQEKVKVSEGNEVISYNIYGHQPTCFFPTSNKTGETYHICLDVSKTDSDPNASYSNNFSFALFIIEKPNSSIKFIGRTTLIKGENPKNNYDIDKTTHLYYNVDIIDDVLNNEKWKKIMNLKELTCAGPFIEDGKRIIDHPNSFMRTVKTKEIEGGKRKSRKNQKKSQKGKKQGGKRTRKANKKTHRCSSYGCRH